MFKELINFKYKRNKLQAFGFYIVYFIIGIVLAMIASGIIQFNSAADYQTQYNLGVKIGCYVSIVYCTALALTILIAKKLYKSIWGILLFLLTILGTLIMSCTLGCIFPAILSTFEPKE